MTVIPQLERQLAGAARRRRRRNVRATVIAAAIAIAVGAALLAPLLDSDPSRRNLPATPAPTPKPTSGNPPLEDLLAVFRRPRTPHDKANFTQRDLEASHDAQPGESPADSRRVDLPSGPVYLWRMTDGVCVSWGNCLKTGALAQLGVALGYGGHSSRGGRSFVTEVSGIVIDGIDEVELDRERGEPLVVPVKDNVFRVRFGEEEVQPTGIGWRQDGRRRHQEISLP